MRLKNYNEDLVLDTVKIVLKDRTDMRATRPFILDVAAYVLNRIPPKYIMSERGFTHEVLRSGGMNETEGQRLVNVIELITHVNRAIDVVARRRRDGVPRGERTRTPTAGEKTGEQITYFYNMPHIFGRIVDARDGKPVISAEATLWINDRIAAPAESGWRNPYLTNEQTSGYFSFWPQVETGESDSMRMQMTIGFQHAGYEPLEFRRNLKVPGEFFVYDYIRGDKLLDVGTLAMQPAG
jgi:competence protein ComFB